MRTVELRFLGCAGQGNISTHKAGMRCFRGELKGLGNALKMKSAVKCFYNFPATH